MTLFFIKIIVTVSIVLGLSVIAERLSPRWAGMLGGFPLSVAIVLIFIGIEEGSLFASHSAVHTVAGLGANVSIFATYGLVLSLRPQLHWVPTVILGLTSFFSVGFLLAEVPFTLISASLFALCIILGCHFAFKRFVELKIKEAVKLSFWVTLVRAASACFVVIAITALAEALGTERAGVLAGFPATVLPMVAIIHATYGAVPVLTIIKHFPMGLIATVVFCNIYGLYLQELDMLWGTIAAFGAATVYLLGYSSWQEKRRRSN